MEFEKDSLLSETCGCSCHRTSHHQQTRKKNKFTSYVVSVSIVLNAILAFLCLGLITHVRLRIHGLSVGQELERFDVPEIYSPARNAIEYEWRSAYSNVSSFRGEPDDNFEQRWSQLLSGTLIKVSKEELQQTGELTSVPFQDGGYGAGLGVSHHLHCLKRIKEFIWLEELGYSFERKSAKYRELQEHADHCFDTLRQQIMCHADTSLFHLEYVYHSRLTHKPAVAQRSDQMCVRWDRLHDWMQSRSGNADLFVQPKNWDLVY